MLLGATFFVSLASAEKPKQKMLLPEVNQEEVGKVPAKGYYMLVNKSTQTAKFYKDGQFLSESVCGTGLGFTKANTTHNGRHRFLEKKGRNHVNHEGVPMPFTIRFTADQECVHGNRSFVTMNGKGMPQSHGCVRFPVEVAEWIYDRFEVGDIIDVIGSEEANLESLGITALYEDGPNGTLRFKVDGPNPSAADIKLAREMWIGKRIFTVPRGETNPEKIKVCLPCMPVSSRMSFLKFESVILTSDERRNGLHLTLDHSKRK